MKLNTALRRLVAYGTGEMRGPQGLYLDTAGAGESYSTINGVDLIPHYIYIAKYGNK